MPPAPRSRSRRSELLLAAGAVAGLLLVALRMTAPAEGPPPIAGDAVATVDGAAIPQAVFSEALDRYTAGRDGAPAAADSAVVLEALIEEELLVQRAEELGVDRNDRLVRDLMAKTVLDLVAMEAESSPPSDAAVAAFYAEHANLFAPETEFRLREIRVEVNDFRSAAQAERRAREATARLRAGEDFARVARVLGDRPADPLPAGYVTETEAVRRLGAAAAARALAQPVGETGEPLRSGRGFHVVQVLDRRSPAAPPLAEVETRVRAEMRRRAHADAIRAYVAELRERAEIRTAVGS